MKYFFFISGVIVLLIFNTVFATSPVYYSEDECNIEKDLKNYREILQDDMVVKTFMQKYPDAISIPSSGIDDSDPPQTSVHYLYEDNTTNAQLTLRIFEHLADPHDCFTPFSYTLNYQNDTKTLRIINYGLDTQELRGFLNNVATPSSITPDDLLANYENSDLILEGKVISLDSAQNQTKYDIQVEHYYKNQKQSKLISVFELPKDDSKPAFQKDDRVVLYIKQEKGKYTVQDPSFKVNYDCNAGSWGSLLAPTYEDVLIRRSPATGNFPEFSESDDVNGMYKAGKEMQITYHVENYGPLIKHATVHLSISSNQKVVFSDERRITVPACGDRVPLNWDFTPQSGNYFVLLTVSGTYEVNDKSFQFREPRVENSFMARKSLTERIPEATVYANFSDPDYSIYSLNYKQFKYFIPYKILEATIQKMELDCKSANFLIYLQEAKEGSLTITIPRKMFDAKIGPEGNFVQDDDFFVLVDGAEPVHKEVASDEESRTLQIAFAKNTKIIEIIGPNLLVVSNMALCGLGDSEESSYYTLLAPLQQSKSGIPAGEIQCKKGLEIIIRSDDSPACVNLETMPKLFKRGIGFLTRNHMPYSPYPDHN